MKAILVIDEMPHSCDECEVRCGGYTAKEYSEKGIKRPTWCPLKPLPRKVKAKNGLVERMMAVGWNECLKEITGETE